MKLRIIVLALLLPVFLCLACDDENNPTASDELDLGKNFGPSENAASLVKELYKDYGLWVRMDFDNPKEVANAILANDPLYWNAYTQKIEEEDRESALLYTKSLMSTVTTEFSNKYFPQEFFFVKIYGFNTNLKQLGRTRLVIAWPSQLEGALPVTDPDNHYFQDSLLAAEIWNKIGNMMALRIPESLTDFVAVGKPYDGGAVFDEYEELYKDEDEYAAAEEKYCREMGYISGSGSWSFEYDFAQWTALVAINSYDYIKENYLDNSPIRAEKYKAFVKFFKDNGWDIQAAGNLYNEKYQAFKATLPPVDNPE